MMNPLHSMIPKELIGRLAIEAGTLHISEELRGQPKLDSFVSLARRRGITDKKFYTPKEFDQKYGAAARTEWNGTSGVQAYAVKLLADAYERGASDIHIADYGAYTTIQLRRLGMLQEHDQLPGENGRALIRVIYETMSHQTDAAFSRTERQDGRIATPQYLPKNVHSVRVHTEPIECNQAKDGTGSFMALRLLYDSTKASGTLEERVSVLGHTPEDAARLRFLTQRTGMTIISGPTGHGKSTLLKHVMESMAEENPEKSHLSIEDPPEYPLANVKQIKVTTNMGSAIDPAERGRAYTNTIAGAMRSDPDVMMIGEIRYPEAAAAAIDAALTGHGVWATLHANNAFGIIRRMVSLLNAAKYVDPLEYLCDHNVLAGLVYQRLVPLLCPECGIPLQKAGGRLPEPVFNRLLRVLDDLDGVRVRGDGCERCRNLGIVGQTVAAEVIACDQALLSHLRRGDFQRAHTYWKHDLQGRTYVGHAVDLISKGQVDPHLAELRLGVPLDFDKVFEQVQGGGQ